MIIVSYILMIGFGIFCRLPFSLIENISTSDNAGVKAKLNALRKHGFSYFIPNALNLGGFFPRPILFHYLVSKLPKKLWRISLVLLNSSFDVIAGVLTIFLIQKLFPSQITLQAQILLFGIAISTPILFPATGRLKATNNRAFGLFLNQLYFAIFLGFEFEIGTIITMSVLASITILSSTFASQLLLFVSVFFSVITLDVKLLIPLIVVVTFAFALNPLGIRDIILFKWVHLKFTAKTKTSAFSLSDKALFFNKSMLKNAQSLEGLIDIVLHRSGIVKLLWGLPSLFVLIGLCIYHNYAPFFSNEIYNVPFHNTIFLIVSVLVVFVLTSFGWGRLVGESERYLEILSFTIPVGLATLVADNLLGNHILLLIFISHILIVLGVSMLNTPGAIEKLSDFDAGFNPSIAGLTDLIKNSGKTKIATIPIRLSRTLTTHLDEEADNYQFYYRLICEKPILKKGIDRFLEESDNVNFLRISPLRLKQEYGVEMIILENRFAKGLAERFVESLSRDCEQYFSNDQYTVYVIN